MKCDDKVLKTKFHTDTQEHIVFRNINHRQFGLPDVLLVDLSSVCHVIWLVVLILERPCFEACEVCSCDCSDRHVFWRAVLT